MLMANKGGGRQDAQDYPHFSRFVSNFHSPALKRWQSFTVLVLDKNTILLQSFDKVA